MLIKISIPFIVAFVAIFTLAQNRIQPDRTPDIATADLEDVLRQAVKLDDKLTSVVVRARAAVLISYSDPARSDAIFLEIWKLANEETDKSFDKEKAKLQILKYLFTRNSKLARRLVAEQSKSEASSSQAARGRDDDASFAPRLAFELMDTDPVMAAALLEKSLSNSITPAGLGTLFRLREKDSFLSDYIAAGTLDTLTNRPSLVSLPGLQLMTGYVFPGPEASLSSVEAEASLQQLQFKYFVIGYDLLKASLSETKEMLMKDYRYTQRDLEYRNANQGMIAGILAALAPRMQPALSAELNDVAGRLSPQVPANIAQMTQFALRKLTGEQIRSDDPEQQFAFALSKGDFVEAHKQLDLINDDAKKEIYTQLLSKNEARTLLKQSEIMKAVILIRKLPDQTTRLVMYLDAFKVAKKKHDMDLTTIIVNEARLLIPQVDRNGLHARALLSFAAQVTDGAPNDDAIDFLDSAVTTINVLALRSSGASPKSMAEEAMAELNNPNSLLDAPELEQAFSAIGLIDLEHALEEARRIEPRAVQLTARIEAIQGVIKRASSRPKLSTPPAAKPANTRASSPSIPRL